MTDSHAEDQRCPHCGKPLELRQDEKGPNAPDLANNGAHVDLCRRRPYEPIGFPGLRNGK